MSAGRFVSVDWGTSRLRLSLVDPEPFAVLESVESDDGVAAVYDRWLIEGGDRESYFEKVLRSAMARLSGSFEGLPIVISGMAAASIGWRELPYACLPQSLEEPLPFAIVGANRDVTLISGLRWGTQEVLRGEESQWVGLASLPGLNLPPSYRLILPGTHSKHMQVENGTLTQFQTFITGDLFRAIGEHTILKHAVSIGEGSDPENEAFLQGVGRAQEGRVDQSLFGIRCAGLFGERSGPENAEFLSGLLIGSELASVGSLLERLVVPEGGVGNRYLLALEAMGKGGQALSVPMEWFEQAVPRAQALFPAYRQVIHDSKSGTMPKRH